MRGQSTSMSHLIPTTHMTSHITADKLFIMTTKLRAITLVHEHISHTGCMVISLSNEVRVGKCTAPVSAIETK